MDPNQRLKEMMRVIQEDVQRMKDRAEISHASLDGREDLLKEEFQEAEAIGDADMITKIAEERRELNIDSGAALAELREYRIALQELVEGMDKALRRDDPN